MSAEQIRQVGDKEKHTKEIKQVRVKEESAEEIKQVEVKEESAEEIKQVEVKEKPAEETKQVEVKEKSAEETKQGEVKAKSTEEAKQVDVKEKSAEETKQVGDKDNSAPTNGNPADEVSTEPVEAPETSETTATTIKNDPNNPCPILSQDYYNILKKKIANEKLIKAQLKQMVKRTTTTIVRKQKPRRPRYGEEIDTEEENNEDQPSQQQGKHYCQGHVTIQKDVPPQVVPEKELPQDEMQPKQPKSRIPFNMARKTVPFEETLAHREKRRRIEAAVAEYKNPKSATPEHPKNLNLLKEVQRARITHEEIIKAINSQMKIAEQTIAEINEHIMKYKDFSLDIDDIKPPKKKH
uniref:SCHIP-1 domain-containing protein n=1 Tax=Rhabditophanes sp. KR3021 TaxID=114890 RepID=A0AC35UB70_9BILA